MKLFANFDNMKRTISLALLLLSAAFASAAQDATVDKIIELGKNDNRVMHHADFLANRIGGRPVGSNALTDAERWVAGQFESWGLEVMVQEVGRMAVGFNRGPAYGRMLSEDGMVLHFGTPAYTAGTHGAQKGHVLIEPRTKAEFERMKGALKGAWVLVDGDSNGFPLPHSAAADKRRAEKIAAGEFEPALFYREMVKAGVLGFIQSAKVPLTILYDRECCNDITMDSLPEVCDIKLDAAQYEIIKKKVLEYRDFQLEFDIRNHFSPGPIGYHNIIGMLKGSEFPDEYVMLGGHLDAYDSGTGAVDDGNGTSVTMEAARLLAAAGARPRRTILFCIWTGEEYGLLGSRYFVEHATVPLDRISNYFNRDGGPLMATSVTVPPAMYDDFVKACEPITDYNPDIPFTVNRREGEPGPRPEKAGGSDHAYFAMNGVPTISLRETDPKGYNFNYREIWHTENDCYGKLIPEYLEHSATVSAVIAYGLACMDSILSRDGLYK